MITTFVVYQILSTMPQRRCVEISLANLSGYCSLKCPFPPPPNPWVAGVETCDISDYGYWGYSVNSILSLVPSRDRQDQAVLLEPKDFLDQKYFFLCIIFPCPRSLISSLCHQIASQWYGISLFLFLALDFGTYSFKLYLKKVVGIQLTLRLLMNVNLTLLSVI